MQKNLKTFSLFAALVVFISSGCEKTDKEITYPTVTTAEVTDIKQMTATSGGEVTFDGNAAVTKGICWSTSENPTTEDNHTTDGMGEGAFVSQITGLAPSVKYYVRAYATNSHGTAYGNQQEFTTPI